MAWEMGKRARCAGDDGERELDLSVWSNGQDTVHSIRRSGFDSRHGLNPFILWKVSFSFMCICCLVSRLFLSARTG